MQRCAMATLLASACGLMALYNRFGKPNYALGFHDDAEIEAGKIASEKGQSGAVKQFGQRNLKLGKDRIQIRAESMAIQVRVPDEPKPIAARNPIYFAVLVAKNERTVV